MLGNRVSAGTRELLSASIAAIDGGVQIEVSALCGGTLTRAFVDVGSDGTVREVKFDDNCYEVAVQNEDETIVYVFDADEESVAAFDIDVPEDGALKITAYWRAARWHTPHPNDKAYEVVFIEEGKNAE